MVKASAEPPPGEIPPGSSTWATDPLSGPLPPEKSPAAGTPEGIAAEVRASQPGVWPTSLLDLDGPGNGTGPETFDFLAEPATEPESGRDPEPAVDASPLFTVRMQITPLGESGSTLRYDLTAVGQPADVYALVESTARTFVEQIARS